MKKMIASVLFVGLVLLLTACMERGTEISSNGLLHASPTEIVENVPVSAEYLPTEKQAVILTYGNEDRFTLGKTFDYDAFLGWLPEYFGALCGEPLVVAVSDIIDGGDEGELGTVTVLAEYHTMEALESGRSADTVCGGCNLFFQYDRETGADFSEMKFAGDVLLHNYYVKEPRDLSDWTATVDTRGFVQLVKAGETPIETPAEYRWDLLDFTELHQLYVRGDRILLVLLEHRGTELSVIERSVAVYTSDDGGGTWNRTELDYTPTTTTVVYSVGDIVLNMRDDMKGTVILGTSRCEVFFYTTEDGGKTWKKQRNFKLLNYRYEALLDGGLVTDTLGFITFEARDSGNPNVYITYDGGKTWTLMDIRPPDESVDGWVEFCEHRGYPVNAFSGEWDAYALCGRLEDGPNGKNTVVSIPVYVNGERFFDYTSLDFGKSWHWGITFGLTRTEDGLLEKTGLIISYLEENEK